MNKKFALPFFLLASHVSLAAFADDVEEIVVTGTRSNSGSTDYSSYANTDTQTSGAPSATISTEAHAQKTAAEAKGQKLRDCHELLSTLDKSKFACSDDGDIIDVVEVVGVKENDTDDGWAATAESEGFTDNSRPAPPAVWPRPESCSPTAIAVKLAECKKNAIDKFVTRNNTCIVAGGVVAVVGAGAYLYVEYRTRDPEVKKSIKETVTHAGSIGAAVGVAVQQLCSGYYSAISDADAAQCDLDEKTKIQECSKYE